MSPATSAEGDRFELLFRDLKSHLRKIHANQGGDPASRNLFVEISSVLAERINDQSPDEAEKLLHEAEEVLGGNRAARLRSGLDGWEDPAPGRSWCDRFSPAKTRGGGVPLPRGRRETGLVEPRVAGLELEAPAHEVSERAWPPPAGGWIAMMRASLAWRIVVGCIRACHPRKRRSFRARDLLQDAHRARRPRRRLRPAAGQREPHPTT